MNTRSTPSVQLVKSWSGTVGETTLKIGSTDGTSDVASKDLTGANKGNGQTVAKTVDTGTYFFSEVNPGSAWTPSFGCTGAAATATKISDYDYSVVVASGETVVCTFKNTRNTASVQLVKSWSGTVGETTLKIGSTDGTSDVASKDLTGANKGNGQTVAKTVDTGTYFFSEVNPGSAWTPSFGCTGAAATATKISDYDYSVVVASGETVVCTFTNTRNTASVQLVKSWSGTVGETTLKIGSTDGTSDVASKDLTGANKGNGQTVAKTVDTGTYFFSEVNPGSAWTPSFGCTGAAATATKISDYDYSVVVASGETVVCTFKNTRNTASVQLVKSWSGTVGETTLKIGSTDGTSDVASKDLTGANKGNGQTVAKTVDTGTYFFSEVNPGSAWTPSFGCTGAAATATKISDYDYSVVVASGETVVCTFTNTRNTASVQLVKSWSGTVGETTLKIGSTDGTSDVASKDLTGANKGNGQTVAKTVDTGTYFFSEVNPGSAWTPSFGCTGAAATATKISDYDYSVVVASGETVVCTFTNTRNTASVQLVKSWSGTVGETTLKIGSTDGTSDVASKDLTGANKGNGQTVAKTVDTGTYFFSEVNPGSAWTPSFGCTGAAATATKISDYDYSVVVASGETVVCTFTNTRNTASVQLVKSWSGTVGETTLKIGSTDGTSDVASKDLTGANKGNGQTVAKTVDTGTYFFSEVNPGSAWTPSFGCTGAAATATKISDYDYSVVVASGETVVCTFTNTRNTASVQLVKSWSGTVGETTLKIGSTDGTSDVASKDLTGANKGNGQTVAKTVDTGTYFFSEVNPGSAWTPSFGCTDAAATETKISDYDYSVVVASGETVVCTFKNTRN